MSLQEDVEDFYTELVAPLNRYKPSVIELKNNIQYNNVWNKVLDDFEKTKDSKREELINKYPDREPDEIQSYIDRVETNIKNNYPPLPS